MKRTVLVIGAILTSTLVFAQSDEDKERLEKALALEKTVEARWKNLKKTADNMLKKPVHLVDMRSQLDRQIAEFQKVHREFRALSGKVLVDLEEARVEEAIDYRQELEELQKKFAKKIFNTLKAHVPFKDASGVTFGMNSEQLAAIREREKTTGGGRVGAARRKAQDLVFQVSAHGYNLGQVQRGRTDYSRKAGAFSEALREGIQQNCTDQECLDKVLAWQRDYAKRFRQVLAGKAASQPSKPHPLAVSGSTAQAASFHTEFQLTDTESVLRQGQDSEAERAKLAELEAAAQAGFDARDAGQGRTVVEMKLWVSAPRSEWNLDHVDLMMAVEKKLRGATPVSSGEGAGSLLASYNESATKRDRAVRQEALNWQTLRTASRHIERVGGLGDPGHKKEGDQIREAYKRLRDTKESGYWRADNLVDKTHESAEEVRDALADYIEATVKYRKSLADSALADERADRRKAVEKARARLDKARTIYTEVVQDVSLGIIKSERGSKETPNRSYLSDVSNSRENLKLAREHYDRVKTAGGDLSGPREHLDRASNAYKAALGKTSAASVHRTALLWGDGYESSVTDVHDDAFWDLHGVIKDLLTEMRNRTRYPANRTEIMALLRLLNGLADGKMKQHSAYLQRYRTAIPRIEAYMGSMAKDCRDGTRHANKLVAFVNGKDVGSQRAPRSNIRAAPREIAALEAERLRITEYSLGFAERLQAIDEKRKDLGLAVLDRTGNTEAPETTGKFIRHSDAQLLKQLFDLLMEFDKTRTSGFAAERTILEDNVAAQKAAHAAYNEQFRCIYSQEVASRSGAIYSWGVSEAGKVMRFFDRADEGLGNAAVNFRNNEYGIGGR